MQAAKSWRGCDPKNNKIFACITSTQKQETMRAVKPGYRLSGSVLAYVKEALINPSFRRMPESMWLNSLDPGMRRDDGK